MSLELCSLARQELYSCKEAGKEDCLTLLLGQFSNEIFFQKIMLAALGFAACNKQELPVKSGLRSYGELRLTPTVQRAPRHAKGIFMSTPSAALPLCDLLRML